MTYNFLFSLIQQIANTNTTLFFLSHFSSPFFECDETVSRVSDIVSNFSFFIVLSDNLNREGSCNGTDWQTWFWVLLSVVVLGLLVAVVLGLLAKWGRIKLCHHGTFQTGVGSFELSTAHNNKGHYARSEDAMDEGSQVESEGTNGLGWDDEVMPPEL